MELTEGLSQTVGILEKTKSSFKSQELGQLRTKLERLLKKAKKLKASRTLPKTTRQEK
jgi:hypothetical protein